MKPTMVDTTAIFNPQGFMDGSKSEAFVDSSDLKFLKSVELQAVFISLKKVISFNGNGLDAFGKLFDKIKAFKKDESIMVGFCDYSQKIHDNLSKLLDDDTKINLVNDQKGISLFVGTPDIKTDSKVVVWTENITQRSNILMKLRERGIDTLVPSTKDEYFEMKNKSEVEYVLENSFFGTFAHSIPITKLAKAIVYKLDEVVNMESIEKFDMNYHYNSLHIGYKNYILDCVDTTSIDEEGFAAIQEFYEENKKSSAALVFANIKKLNKETILKIKESKIKIIDNLEKHIHNIESIGRKDNVSRNLNKSIVKNLPIFVDASVNTLNTLTNTTPVKEHIKLRTLEIDDKIDKANLIATSIGFMGDIEARAILIISRTVAQKACLMFVGEELESDEELEDAMKEFVNIIGGQVKTLFREVNIETKITIPGVYKNITELEEDVKGNKGIEILLYFKDEPFYLYVTR